MYYLSSEDGKSRLWSVDRSLHLMCSVQSYLADTCSLSLQLDLCTGISNFEERQQLDVWQALLQQLLLNVATFPKDLQFRFVFHVVVMSVPNKYAWLDAASALIQASAETCHVPRVDDGIVNSDVRNEWSPELMVPRLVTLTVFDEENNYWIDATEVEEAASHARLHVSMFGTKIAALRLQGAVPGGHLSNLMQGVVLPDNIIRVQEKGFAETLKFE